LQPADNELYNEGPDSHSKQDDMPLSGKAVDFITELVTKMFAKMQKASPAEILDSTLAKIKQMAFQVLVGGIRRRTHPLQLRGGGWKHL